MVGKEEEHDGKGLGGEGSRQAAFSFRMVRDSICVKT